MEQQLSEFGGLKEEWARRKDDISQLYRGVVVSVSGGVDSTALFHLILALTKAEKKIPVALFHIHYGLRADESDFDFTFARELADAANVPFLYRIVSPDERLGRGDAGVQDWARRLRRTEYQRLAADGWLVALAHHQGDLAENVLLRMARGTGPKTLLGMEPWSPPLWRPLLGETKAALARFLTAAGLPHREDRSNEGTDYTRNVIRHRILPELEALFPGAAGRIVACAADAADLGRWCDSAPFAASELSALPRGAARARLAQAIQTQCGDLRMLSRAFLDQALDAYARITPGSGLKGRITSALPGGGRLIMDDQGIHCEGRGAATKPARSDQHSPSAAGPDAYALLEPGSHALIRQPQQECCLAVGFSAKQVALSPIHLRVYGVVAGTSLRFAQTAKPWRLKGLLQSWLVPPAERRRLVAFEINNQVAGLFGGNGLYAPGPDGAKTECSQTGFDLRYLSNQGCRSRSD